MKDNNYDGATLFFSLIFLFLDAWMFKLSWTWVIVPLFGLAPLSYWGAFALIIFTRIFINHSDSADVSSSHVTQKEYLHVWGKEIGFLILVLILFLLSLAI